MCIHLWISVILIGISFTTTMLELIGLMLSNFNLVNIKKDPPSAMTTSEFEFKPYWRFVGSVGASSFKVCCLYCLFWQIGQKINWNNLSNDGLDIFISGCVQGVPHLPHQSSSGRLPLLSCLCIQERYLRYVWYKGSWHEKLLPVVSLTAASMETLLNHALQTRFWASTGIGVQYTHWLMTASCYSKQHCVKEFCGLKLLTLVFK